MSYCSAIFNSDFAYGGLILLRMSIKRSIKSLIEPYQISDLARSCRLIIKNTRFFFQICVLHDIKILGIIYNSYNPIYKDCLTTRINNDMQNL